MVYIDFMFVDFLKCLIDLLFELLVDIDVCKVIGVFLVCIVWFDGDYLVMEILCIDCIFG